MSFSQQISGQRRPNSAFTLFELIGVLTIISIILAMVAPMTLQMLKLQRQQADKAALPEIAQALKLAMLREQSFPSTSTWWDMVARHGAGSANEIRYSDNQQSVERRLYFADSTLEGDSFFDIVRGSGASGQWLTNFDNPSELRLLILSTINPDLLLPATLSTTAFNAIWTNWSNAPGAPTASNVGSFGLDPAWAGRAGELNIERIDLRDFLCQVAIENACFADGFYDSSTGDLKEFFMPSEFNPDPNVDYVRDSWQISTHNLAGAQVALNLTNPQTADVKFNAGTVNEYITQYEVIQLDPNEPVRVLNAGRIIDEDIDAEIKINSQVVINENLSTGEYVCLVYDKDDPSLRGPMKLKDPDKPNVPYNLQIHILTSPSSDRYFFKGQSLLLVTPWNQSEVGTVPITENQSTLRFDGLSWHY